jgi:hypothetical protein
MRSGAPSLAAFVLRTFLWLPPCFAAWYFSAKYHAALAGGLARLMVDVFTPGVLSALEQPDVDLAFVTTIQAQSAPGQAGVLVPEVSPLLYTYGLALFLALMLAARARWWKILAGAVLLLPFQSWGIAFDFLAQIGIRMGPEVAGQAGLGGWRTETVALGYQIGTLILPSLVPVVAWAAFNRTLLEGLLRARTGGTPPVP